MTGDNDKAPSSIEEATKKEDESRRKFIEDGSSAAEVPDGRVRSDDRLTGIVSEDEETGLIDPFKRS